MSLFQTIGRSLGKTIIPLEEPAIYQLAIPDPEVSLTETINFPFKPATVLRFTNALISEASISPNFLFSMPELEPLSFFSELKSSRVLDVKNVVIGSIISDDLLQQYPNAWISEDLSIDRFNVGEEATVSQNLFQPLSQQRVNGKNYGIRVEQHASQQDLFNKKAKTASDGFRKAYRREKTPGSISNQTTHTLTFWDLLYPVLLPPLNEHFESQFELYQPLFKFQPAGIDFLVRNESALLADEMGTGKTVMSSVALKILFRLGKIRRALIVCPVSVLRTWQEHLTNWAGELALTVVKGTPEVRKLDWKYDAHIYLTTYDTIASDFLTKIKKENRFSCPNCNSNLNLGDKIFVGDENMPTYSCPKCKFGLNDYLIGHLPKKHSIVDPEILNSFDVVLIDEAQYIKNRGSDRSRAIRLLRPIHRWALTGTPVENSLEDLVSIFSFVKPDLFKNQYPTTRRAVELITPHFLRRLKIDVMKDLPPKVKQEIWLQLDEDQRKAYKIAEQLGIREIEELGGRVTKIHIFSLITKLKQICNFAPSKETSAKTDELLDLIEQIKESGQKVLVFSQYDIEGVSKLERLLRPFGVSVLKGSMPEANRHAAITLFKKDPNVCILLATIKTGGVGLTLTEASYVIHFDHWWNPALMWQADDRVHRSGQKSSQVNIYSFWIQDTIEERIHHILKQKGLLFDEVINGLSIDAVDDMISTEEWLGILGIKVDAKAGNSSRAKESSQQQSHRTSQNDGTSGNQQAGRDHHKKSTAPPSPPQPAASDPYEVLGVARQATAAEISQAYKRMAQMYHPDKVASLASEFRELAEARMKEINIAYSVLKSSFGKQ